MTESHFTIPHYQTFPQSYASSFPSAQQPPDPASLVAGNNKLGGTFYAIPVPPLARQVWFNSRQNSSNSNHHRRSLESVSDNFSSSGASLIHFSPLRQETRSSSSVCDAAEQVNINTVDNPLHKEEDSVSEESHARDAPMHSNTYRPAAEHHHQPLLRSGNLHQRLHSPTASECKSATTSDQSSSSSSPIVSGQHKRRVVVPPSSVSVSQPSTNNIHIRLAQKHLSDQAQQLTSVKDNVLLVMHQIELLVCSLEDQLLEEERGVPQVPAMGVGYSPNPLSSTIRELTQLLTVQRKAMAHISEAERHGAMMGRIFQQQTQQQKPRETVVAMESNYTRLEDANINAKKTTVPKQTTGTDPTREPVAANVAQPIWTTPPPLSPSSVSPATPPLKLTSTPQLCSSLHHSFNSQRSQSPLHPSLVFVKKSPGTAPLSGVRSSSPFQSANVPNTGLQDISRLVALPATMTSTFNGSTNAINGVVDFATATASNTNITLSHGSVGQDQFPNLK